MANNDEMNTSQMNQQNCVLHSKMMQLFVLDLSEIFSNRDTDKSESKAKTTVSWQTPIAHFTQAPPETILYSLAQGIDEIILFGGMEVADSNLSIIIKPSHDNNRAKPRVSNKLYVMKPRELFISPAAT